MSRVYFHSPSGEAELSGSERAHAHVLSTDLTLAVLNLDGFNARERLEKLVPEDAYLHAVPFRDDEAWVRSFRTWWSGLGNAVLQVEDQRVYTWDVTLNTILAMGNDALILLARMHATCEIHGYIDGKHREWLAEIIDQGRSDRVLRAGMGWEDVSALLRSRDDEPVVMSYSVCEQFPDPWSIYYEDGVEEGPMLEAWEALSVKEQWETAMSWLRDWEQKNGALQITPDMWRSQGFGGQVNAFDLVG